jgi:hypothetical protein
MASARSILVNAFHRKPGAANDRFARYRRRIALDQRFHGRIDSNRLLTTPRTYQAAESTYRVRRRLSPLRRA